MTLKDARLLNWDADPSRLYEFAPFQLDTRKRRLSRDGQTIPLAEGLRHALDPRSSRQATSSRRTTS